MYEILFITGSRSKDEILEYIYFDEEKSVYDARDYCQENNMKLAQEYFRRKLKIIINLTVITNLKEIRIRSQTIINSESLPSLLRNRFGLI